MLSSQSDGEVLRDNKFLQRLKIARADFVLRGPVLEVCQSAGLLFSLQFGFCVPPFASAGCEKLLKLLCHDVLSVCSGGISV